jgi:hypothetical protein
VAKIDITMRRITIKRFLSFIALVVLVVASMTGLPLHAQNVEKEGVGISPTKLTLDADPGEQLSGKFTVTNPGTSPVEYRVYVNDFRIQNEEYEKNFEPVQGALSPVSWFKVPSGVRSLKPGAQEELDYTLTPPKDAVPRGYYAVIFAETLPQKTDGTGVARLKRVGSLVYLTVNGGSVEKGEVVSFESKKWQRNRPVKASLRIKNDGNVHFTATGTVRLKDIFGRTVSKTNISGTILPATIRRFAPELKVGQPFGVYKIEGDVTFLGKTTGLEPKWVVTGSPLWMLLWTVIVVGWAVVLIRLIKRRAKHKKK